MQILSPLLQVCCGLSAQLDGLDDSSLVQEILIRQQSRFVALQSLEYESDMAMQFVEPPPGERIKRDQVHHSHTVFRKEGERYYSSVAMKDISTGEPFETVQSYDEKQYQYYRSDGRRLVLRDSFASTRPYEDPPVPLIPFQFALDFERDLGMVTLRNPERWAEVASNVVGVERRDGSIVVRFKPLSSVRAESSDEWLWEVEFDREADFYPRVARVLAPDGTVVGASTVERLERVGGGETGALVPTRLVQVGKSADGDRVRMQTTFSIDLATLRVNEDVPDDLFTIPWAMADMVETADGKKFQLRVAREKNAREMDLAFTMGSSAEELTPARDGGPAPGASGKSGKAFPPDPADAAWAPQRGLALMGLMVGVGMVLLGRRRPRTDDTVGPK